MRWIGDITAIALEWDPNHDPTIAGYNIYRKLKEDAEAPFKLVAKIPDRFTSHYVDMNLPFQTKYLYRVTAFNHKNGESRPSEAASTITRPTLRSVSYFDSLNKLPRKAKLIWRPHQNGRVASYVVERRIPEKTEWETIAVLKHRLVAEYIDRNLDDNQVYLYRLRAVTFDNIKSTPSDIVKILTKALPTPIADVNVTTNLAAKIKLSWPKHPQEDIAYYSIYRSSEAKSGFELYKKVVNPGFTDEKLAHGSNFFYRVTASDFDGLESDAVVSFNGKTLPRPAKIKLRTAKLEGDQTTLEWDKGDDRTVSYRVLKRENLGWFKTKTTTIDLNTTRLQTTQQPNVGTSYTILGIDENGIDSEPVTTDELLFEKVVQ